MKDKTAFRAHCQWFLDINSSVSDVASLSYDLSVRSLGFSVFMAILNFHNLTN